MIPRDRWRAVLHRKPVDRVPCDIWATPEIFDKLCKTLHCNDEWDVIDKLEIDAPYTLEPHYIGPTLAKNCDMWGVSCRNVSYGTGFYTEAVGHPLALATTVKDIEKYPWPRPDWFDYASLPSSIKGHEHRPIRTGWVEPFYFYSRMRGLEQAMMDLVSAPDMVECAFDRIFDFGYCKLRNILEKIKTVDIVLPSEDLGSQQGPLFSLECFRRFHKLRFKTYIELAKQGGAFVFFHTDGASRLFIPDLIEIGVDILNPIQHKCLGMDRKELKADFGMQLVFHGGVENQEILPFGTVEQVRQEVVKCFETLGIGGGYICAPCHAIQPVTPVENILAMYDTIKDVASGSKYGCR
ncbi:MAG: uroporphyrinogen decarboxylase family protein [Sedimentisphaerales bacterium]